MTIAKALGQEHLDLAPDDLFWRIAEQRGDLMIGEQHFARRIDDDHRVRRGVEHAASQLGRQHDSTVHGEIGGVGSHSS